MKKLFVLFSLTACLSLTYNTTAYANEEETTTQVMPTSDDEFEPFPFDPYSNITPASDDEFEPFPFDPYSNITPTSDDEFEPFPFDPYNN